MVNSKGSDLVVTGVQIPYRLDLSMGSDGPLITVERSEHYWFVFEEHRWRELLEILARYASDPELSFTWEMAVSVKDGVRKLLV